MKISQKRFQKYIDQNAHFLKTNLSNRDNAYYSRVRNKLNAIRLKGSSSDGIVMAFIEVLKKYQKQSGLNVPDGYLHRKHILSDHAFCSALVRMYGVDILKVKDRVMEDIEKHQIKYVMGRDVIITVLGK